MAEKQKIEDYKTQVIYLEREVEELEGERTQLRRQLRNLANAMGGGMSGQVQSYLDKTDQDFEKKKSQNRNVKKLEEELEFYRRQF